MVGYKATKIAARSDVADVSDREHWDEWIDWLIDAGERLRGRLHPSVAFQRCEENVVEFRHSLTSCPCRFSNEPVV